MGDKIRVLFELNILLDVLQEREEFYELSARCLALAETGALEGWLAAHSLTTLFYLIAKDRSADQARVTLTALLQFLKIAPVDQNTIEGALNLPYKDFEDAVQMCLRSRSGPIFYSHGTLAITTRRRLTSCSLWYCWRCSTGRSRDRLPILD